MYQYLKGCVLKSHRIGLDLASSNTIDMCKLEEIFQKLSRNFIFLYKNGMRFMCRPNKVIIINEKL